MCKARLACAVPFSRDSGNLAHVNHVPTDAMWFTARCRWRCIVSVYFSMLTYDARMTSFFEPFWVVVCWLFLTNKSNLEDCHKKLNNGLSGLIGPETVLREYPERSASQSVVKTFRSRRTSTSEWARRGPCRYPSHTKKQVDIGSSRGTKNRAFHCLWGQNVPHGFHELQGAVQSHPSAHL